MADRAFEFAKVRQGGKAISALRITCSRCGRQDEFIQTSERRLPNLAAAQKFRNIGWSVGSVARKDVCPDCQQRKEPMKAEDVKPAAPLRAEPPREMGKDDRRIVFAKIDEVYVGEEKGYDTGWSDERVSADLGVPRAWVTAIREEFFGPAANVGELEEVIRQIDEKAKEGEQIAAQVQRLQHKANEIADALALIDRTSKAHNASLTLLRDRASKIIGGGHG